MTTTACDGQAHEACNGWAFGLPNSKWNPATMSATTPCLGRCECKCHRKK